MSMFDELKVECTLSQPPLSLCLKCQIETQNARTTCIVEKVEKELVRERLTKWTLLLRQCHIARLYLFWLASAVLGQVTLIEDWPAFISYTFKLTLLTALPIGTCCILMQTTSCSNTAVIGAFLATVIEVLMIPCIYKYLTIA